MRIEQLNLPSSSSRPTPAAGSATTALSQSWAIGQLMSVSVVSRVSPDVLQITVDGQAMLARTSVDLPAGAQVTAKVVSTGSQPQLALQPMPSAATPDPEAEAVTTALGRALPQQQPLAEVLPRLIDALASRATDKSLPPAVAQSLESLAQAVPELATLRQPAALANAISHAGLQLEHSLAQVVANVPKDATPPTPAQGAATTQANLLVDDLKWQLMGLREAVMTAVAQLKPHGSEAASPHQPSSLQTTQLSPESKGKTPEPSLALLGPNPGSGALEGLLDDVNAGLARITTHQLQTSNAAHANALLAHFELPVQSNAGLETLDIEVRDEQRSRKTDTPKPLTVMVEIPVGEMGKLRARIALAGERIAITTWSETPALRDLIARHISQLDQALSQQGFEVSPSVVGELNAPKPARTGQGPLIDIQV